MQNDEINNPSHYKLFPDMEAIQVIRAVLTPEEYKGYLKGNALKYRLRAGEKGPAMKCIAKAKWYQDELRWFVAESKPNQEIEWPSSEQRIDAIGQNGNGGEHYPKWQKCPECLTEHCACVAR